VIFLLLLFLISTPLSADDEYLFTDNDGITITGTVQTSQQIDVVEREQIENSGTGDIVELLQETLGLNVVRYGAYGNQAGINIRGFDSKRIAFLINGIPVNSTMDGKFDLNQIDLNSIERIEVIYGGSDSKFNVSGAFGGIVNIITVRRHEEGLRLTASVSNTSALPGRYSDRNGETQEPHWEDLFDTQNYSLFAAYGGEDISLSANIFANRAGNHFIFTDYVNIPRRKDNNEVWDAGLSASLVWELSNLKKLIVSSSVYYGDKNFPTSGFSSNVGNQIDFSVQENVMLEAPRVFHDNAAAELSFGYNFLKREYTAPSGLSSLHNQFGVTAINRWNWFASSRFTIRSGIDYRFINLDSTEIGNRNRHDGGLYVTIELKPAETFMLIPSSKVIFTSQGTGNSAVIPKLGILWNVTDTFSVKNNYFRSFKFPDFEELYWSGGGGYGNPDLRPEDGWGADIGIAWRITSSLRLESVFFTQWIKDSIHWFLGSANVWRPENTGEAVLYGLDNRFSAEIPVSLGPIIKISASLSYQFLLSYLLSYGYTFDSNKRIPYNPEHTIACSLDFSWNSGSIFLSGRYEDKRFHDTANLILLKPVFLLNAGFNQKIGKNFLVYSSLRNILNTSYESFYDYPMPGITLTLGIRATLEVR